ncbi:MAG: AbrB/MazE/SpoVT family DNA-binding domain-containing protein [Oscillospiraceae bacterium]|nr:AbrB/MazE/SpoVT family DNA-binding domain-containing protein [Oscillospiraceae bacterium]
MSAKTMRVNKWGNSLGIRFPSEFVDFVGLKEKSLVEIKTDGEKLVITKIADESSRKTIQEYFKDYPTNQFFQQEEIDWGKPAGDEIW